MLSVTVSGDYAREREREKGIEERKKERESSGFWSNLVWSESLG
jgi:hypothetical protein